VNDHQEFFYTFNKIERIVIKKNVENILKKEKYSDLDYAQKREWSLSYLDSEESKTDLKNSFEKSGFYIGSFCKTSSDLLSQWRGYASGEVGYCIEFDEAKLEKKSTNTANCSIRDCEYDEVKIQKNIDSLTERYENEEIEITTWLTELLALCSYSKHQGFEEENEKRIIMSEGDELNNNVNFRVKGGVLVPYITFKFDKDAIKSITIGPAKHQEICKKSLEMFVTSLEYQDIKIKLSDTPLTT
jgi:hypothetical protein